MASLGLSPFEWWLLIPAWLLLAESDADLSTWLGWVGRGRGVLGEACFQDIPHLAG